MVNFGILRGDCGKVGRHAAFDEFARCFLEFGGVVRAGDGKVEAMGAIELDINEARGEDLALEVDDLVGSYEVGIEG